VYPTITPEPLVMDEVEEWYPTQYRSFQFFPTHDTGEGIRDAITTTIRQTSFGCGKLGATIWPSTLALSCYLVSTFGDDTSSIARHRIIELGSGCGLASSVCRELGVEGVLATDYWEEPNGTLKLANPADGKRLLPANLFGVNLDFNVVKCAGVGNVDVDTDQYAVQKLDWYNEFEAFQAKISFRPNLIIASDVVYYEEDVPPLVRTLEILLNDGDQQEANEGTVIGSDFGERKVLTMETAQQSQQREALLFLPLDKDRKGLPEFQEQVKKLVDSYSGWSLDEKEVKLCLMDSPSEDSVDGASMEYQFLKISITTG
jgi:predicted nicotinamide N-methyase